VLAEVTALGGPGVELLADPELREIALPPIRSDYTAIETYDPAPGPPLTCPVTALIGDADPKVGPAEARGWAERTTGPFDLRVLPGNHFFLATQQPAVLDLLRPLLT
jgi:surfactin synthase thioesterase subunit